MSTPIRFVRRIARKAPALRKEALEAKKADTLIAVAKHFGYSCKRKNDAITKLLEAAKSMA